ncbi:MAG: flavodoxin family protein [Elusimicrobiota bacterium]|jgi:multimeric flavodoxin WrbA|nr:flavodoxin family protein [Elusimicrobiota bacterium]
MKVLLLNGSPNENGCTYTALNEVAKTLQDKNVETEIFQLGKGPVQDCVACRACAKLNNQCVYSYDAVNLFIEKAKQADGLVFGTPVYYAHPSGRVLSFLNRVFFAGSAVFANKPAAAVASARRAGTTASLDVLNKYFTISRMPVVSSSYWNMVHGNTPAEVLQDSEGLQIMQTIGINMAWLISCIEAAKKAGIPYPEVEPKVFTNFIR